MSYYLDETYTRVDVEGAYDVYCTKGYESYIVKCVDAYEQLQAENQRLRWENEKHKESVPKVFVESYVAKYNEAKQLKEALRRCSPWQSNGSYECESCGQLEIEETTCNFCGCDEGTGHTDDCEYLKLCGGK